VDGRATRADLPRRADARFGGLPDDTAIADAVALGVLEPTPGEDDAFLVPSPQELSVAGKLHASGVPLSEITAHLRELRSQVEHIASRFLEFTREHVFAPAFGRSASSTDADVAEAASLVRRLRPLARLTVDTEPARAMGLFATLQLRRHLGSGEAPAAASRTRSVAMPAETMRAVEALVGVDHAVEFLRLAAERELRARRLDELALSGLRSNDVDEHP
jgi:hypothetical protein